MPNEPRIGAKVWPKKVAVGERATKLIAKKRSPAGAGLHDSGGSPGLGFRSQRSRRDPLRQSTRFFGFRCGLALFGPTKLTYVNRATKRILEELVLPLRVELRLPILFLVILVTRDLGELAVFRTNLHPEVAGESDA